MRRVNIIAGLAVAFASLLSYGVSASAADAAPAAGAPETGLAAVYSDRLNGHTTASRERYDRNKLTAAHKALPFGSKVQVTNVSNKKSVVVRINDRGPTQAGRVLDLSPKAAAAIGIKPKAMAEVSVSLLSGPDKAK